MQPVSVIVPTMRRPESLERALRSLFAQTAPMASIVVVDNDPAGTARDTVARLTPQSPCPLIYRHEPRPGVATSRTDDDRACLILTRDRTSYLPSNTLEEAPLHATTDPSDREDPSLDTLIPDDPSTFPSLGIAAQEANDAESAIAAYQKFLDLAPNDPSAAQVQQQIDFLKQQLKANPLLEQSG